MAYIHESALVYHGRLKSSNVLVDSRWTCKVADMGLRLFREGERLPDPESSIYFYSEWEQWENRKPPRVRPTHHEWTA